MFLPLLSVITNGLSFQIICGLWDPCSQITTYFFFFSIFLLLKKKLVIMSTRSHLDKLESLISRCETNHAGYSSAVHPVRTEISKVTG